MVLNSWYFWFYFYSVVLFHLIYMCVLRGECLDVHTSVCLHVEARVDLHVSSCVAVIFLALRLGGFVPQWPRCSGVHCYLSEMLSGPRVLRICLLQPTPTCLVEVVGTCSHVSGPFACRTSSVVTHWAVSSVLLVLNFKNKYFEGAVAQLVKCLPMKHRTLGSIP